MKKPLLLAFFVLGLALVLYLLFQNNPSSSPSVEPLSTPTSDAIKLEPTSNPPSTNSSAYQLYTPQAFQAASGRRLLFFYANWCPTCQPIDQALQARASELPSDLTVFRVNYNDDEVDEDEAALAQTHSITYQHTFVQVDENGNALQTYNGGDFDTILENLE